jgi:hypothetical protein
LSHAATVREQCAGVPTTDLLVRHTAADGVAWCDDLALPAAATLPVHGPDVLSADKCVLVAAAKPSPHSDCHAVPLVDRRRLPVAISNCLAVHRAAALVPHALARRHAHLRTAASNSRMSDTVAVSDRLPVYGERSRAFGLSHAMRRASTVPHAGARPAGLPGAGGHHRVPLTQSRADSGAHVRSNCVAVAATRQSAERRNERSDGEWGVGAGL